MTTFSEMVTIGRLIKPQGRHGEVVALPLSDRPGRFPDLRRAFVRGSGEEAREVKVLSCWPHKGRFVLKLEGVDSIDAAEALRGLELRIEPGELAALPAGSFYHHDLVGLAAENPSGTALGRVHGILETGAGAPVLVVRDGAREALVPLAAAFVSEVDVAAGRIVLQLSERDEVR